jgi:hypothetical protein
VRLVTDAAVLLRRWTGTTYEDIYHHLSPAETNARLSALDESLAALKDSADDDGDSGNIPLSL